ncbi:hypothetical protein AB4212_45930 [Streptomyces sp. 2MCAF27]
MASAVASAHASKGPSCSGSVHTVAVSHSQDAPVREKAVASSATSSEIAPPSDQMLTAVIVPGGFGEAVTRSTSVSIEDVLSEAR